MVHRAPVFADVAGGGDAAPGTSWWRHNAGFDLGFLRNEMTPIVGGAAALPPLVVDTLQVARSLLPVPQQLARS